jgi:hypothetical protein
VTRNLHRIFARVRARGAKHTHQYLSNHLVDVLDITIVYGVGLGVRDFFGKYVRKNLKRLRA